MLLLLIACSRECPAGSAPEPERARQIQELASIQAPMCFRPAESGVQPDGMMLLDSRWSDQALAARAAHLALHEPLHTPLEGRPDCLERAIAQEARARMAELSLRRALAVSEPALAWGHLESEEALADWLTDHPDPAVDGYRVRCEH